jgi:hypothetical protein
VSDSVLGQVAPAGSSRLLADLIALGSQSYDPRSPALTRLEEALGQEFADRLVAALSERHDRLGESPPNC